MIGLTFISVKLYKRVIFSKASRPSLPLKKTPPLFSVFFNGLYTTFGSPFPGDRNFREEEETAPTRRSEPLRYKVGGPSEVSSEGLCGMGPHDNRLISLLNSVLLYHFSDIRDFIKYGITNLIIWKFTTFTQISYKISAYTTKIRQDGFIRQELLILFFQRNHFLYHIDANTSFIFIIFHNCITVKPYQTLFPKARIFDRICSFLSSGKLGLESNFSISASALEARALFKGKTT